MNDKINFLDFYAQVDIGRKLDLKNSSDFLNKLSDEFEKKISEYPEGSSEGIIMNTVSCRLHEAVSYLEILLAED